MAAFPIRVAVAHASPLITAGLQALLADEADFTIRGRTSADVRDAVDDDVLVTDHHTVRTVLAGHAGRRRVLVVTHLDGEADVRAAFGAGAQGYLLQDCTRDERVAALHGIHRGTRCVNRAVANVLAEGFGRPTLTLREAQVLELLTLGSCNKTIACQLGISLGTVKAHMRQVLDKLEARSRTEAVVLATRRGLVRAER